MVSWVGAEIGTTTASSDRGLAVPILYLSCRVFVANALHAREENRQVLCGAEIETMLQAKVIF